MFLSVYGALALCCYLDSRYRRVPNGLLLVITLLLVIYLDVQLSSLLAATALSLALWGLKVWGGADAKLFIVLSMCLRWPELILSWWLTLVAGGGLCLVYLLAGLCKSEQRPGLPYVVAIVAGFAPCIALYGLGGV